nr:olfactory receptor 143 [Microplitis mediator]
MKFDMKKMENPGFEYAIKWSKISLTLLGIWPNINYSISQKINVVFDIIFFITTTYLPNLGAIILMWGDIDSMVHLLSYNMATAVSIIKYIVFYKKRNVLASLIEFMKEDWIDAESSGNVNKMMSNAKIGRTLAFISIAYTPITIFLYIIVEIHLKPATMFLYGQHPKILTNIVWPSYLPFNLSIYTLELMRVCQVTGLLGASLIYGTFDTFLAVLILNLCSQLSIVRNQLRHVCSNSRDTELTKYKFDKELRTIIQRHEHLMKIGETIEETFNLVLLPQLMCYTLNFCFQGYSMLMSMAKMKVSFLQMAFYISYDTNTLYHLFIFCWMGELLYNESISVGYAYYQSLWYNYLNVNIKLFMFIGYRCSRPLRISAGKFGYFSFNLFVAVIKTSVGYLSMLRAVQSRKS